MSCTLGRREKIVEINEPIEILYFRAVTPLVVVYLYVRHSHVPHNTPIERHSY